MMKRHAPAAIRNREPILGVLREELPPGKVLEIASGSGEHASFFARELPDRSWQPSDASDEALASIEAYRADGGPANLLPALRLDAAAGDWPVDDVAAIVCINMIHIAPWRACEGLFAGAGRHLASGAPLVLYGPFRFHGAFTAPSNAAFDAGLREQNPEWGVRDVDDLDAPARRHGFVRQRIVSLPANNHAIVFRRT